MTHDQSIFLCAQLRAFIAGEDPPSIRDPDYIRTLQAIGDAASACTPHAAAILANAALAAMLERLICAARAERTTALFIDKTRGA